MTFSGHFFVCHALVVGGVGCARVQGGWLEVAYQTQPRPKYRRHGRGDTSVTSFFAKYPTFTSYHQALVRGVMQTAGMVGHCGVRSPIFGDRAYRWLTPGNRVQEKRCCGEQRWHAGGEAPGTPCSWKTNSSGNFGRARNGPEWTAGPLGRHLAAMALSERRQAATSLGLTHTVFKKL
jgi:hypothetical protein